MSLANKKKWTVFFLIKSITHSDLKNVIYLLNEIKGIDFEPHVNVIFLINFNREYYEDLIKFNTEDITRAEETYHTTMFFRISRGSGKTNHLQLIGEKPDFDITDPKDIKEYFQMNILQKNPADRYILFTWDHGDGFGIFEVIGKVRSSNEERNPILSMEELNSAISGAWEGEKVDLMIMMNCYMQLVDTVYALRNNVDYLIAPQTFMGFKDYDYKQIFNFLSSDPDLATDSLGESIVDIFWKNKENITNDVSISMCRLKRIDGIVAHLGLLAHSLRERVNLVGIDNLKEIFNEAHLVDKNFIDLKSLLHQLKTDANREELKIINELIDFFDDMIVVFFTNLNDCEGSSFKCHYGVSAETPFTYPIPLESLKRNLAFSNWQKTEFSKNTEWGKLMSYLRKQDMY